MGTSSGTQLLKNKKTFPASPLLFCSVVCARSELYCDVWFKYHELSLGLLFVHVYCSIGGGDCVVRVRDRD